MPAFQIFKWNSPMRRETMYTNSTNVVIILSWQQQQQLNLLLWDGLINLQIPKNLILSFCNEKWLPKPPDSTDMTKQ